MHIPQVIDGVHVVVRACKSAPVFYISGTAGRIVLKLAVWLDTNKVGVFHKWGMGYVCTCTYMCMQTYLGNGGRIALKFGVVRDTLELGVHRINYPVG